MESILGKTCSFNGTFGDATPFGKSSVNVSKKLCEDLGMTGENKYGLEMMYCGFTGMPMGEVFIGPVYYQRLKHLVSDKMHARNSGDKSTHTRQPLNYFRAVKVSLKRTRLVVVITARLLVAGTTLRASTTTLSWKRVRGSRLIAEPDGNKVEDWAIRRRSSKPALIGHEGFSTIAKKSVSDEGLIS